MPTTHDPSTRITRIAWPLLAAFGLSFGGAAFSAPSSAATAPDRSDPLYGAHQLVLVTTADWDDNQGTLRRFERPDDAAPWHQVASFPVSIGRAGSAWGIGLHDPADAGAGPRKREGDGRSPAGVFALGTAFGYPDQARSGLPYAQMQSTSWCMDVPGSPLYNRIVDTRQTGQDAVAGSTEPMRLDLHNDGDRRYRLGFVIGHNPDNVAQGGSCIFAHLWRKPGETTAGCTAMGDADLEAMLEWLDADKSPRFVLLPQAEHERLAHAWHLPAVHGDAP